MIVLIQTLHASCASSPLAAQPAWRFGRFPLSLGENNSRASSFRRSGDRSNWLDRLRAFGFASCAPRREAAQAVQHSNSPGMFSFDSLGHINVVVPDLEEATSFYRALFDASVEQTFPHFKNPGFARSAGFGGPRICRCEHSFPEDSVWPIGGFVSGTVHVSRSSRPAGGHAQEDERRRRAEARLPAGHKHRRSVRACEIPRRRALDQRFARVPAVFHQPDQAARDRTSRRGPRHGGRQEAICQIVKGIRFFYAIDRYGIEWEFEEGHADIDAAEGRPRTPLRPPGSTIPSAKFSLRSMKAPIPDISRDLFDRST